MLQKGRSSWFAPLSGRFPCFPCVPWFASVSPAARRLPEEAPGKPLPTVTVSYPLQREVTDYQDYTGRTAAVDSVQVQARVTGYLNKIYFTEGAEVTEGTVLYEIDPRPYQASYDAAKAQVAPNVASLELARQNNARFKKLAKDQAGAVTQVDLDQYQSQEDQAVANLDYARANLETAKLNLDWTKVTAPVSGLIGRLLVTRGNLITANQTTLTTIVRQDPMWVYFDVDEPTVLQVRGADPPGEVRAGQAGTTREDPVPPPAGQREGLPARSHPGLRRITNSTRLPPPS